MPTVVLKLFAGQGTGQTQRRLYASPFGEHKNINHTHITQFVIASEQTLVHVYMMSWFKCMSFKLTN